jgi:cytochrome P450
VITWALTAGSETQARFMAGSVAILARHHRTAAPITRIRVAGTVLGETAEGAVVVPAAVDYVSWTEQVASFAGRPDLASARTRRLWLAGKLSARTRQELTARTWTIEEGVSIVPPASPGAPRS